MHYSVKLDAFEGPLDLLLHLINRYEIDIYDIPVSQITEQYLLYIHAMKELELDIASEYLVMAATLLSIKSKMLLPKKESEVFDEDELLEYEEDPRDELMERLIEYKKFKEAASTLKEKEYDRAQVFSKPPTNMDIKLSESEIEREIQLDVSLYDMLSALQKLMKRNKVQKPVQTRITRQEISIEDKMTDVLNQLTLSKGRKNFLEFFDNADKGTIVTTFLAVLELMKTKKVIVEQENNFKDLFVQKVEEVSNL